MNVKLIICFLVLLSAIKINADSNNYQDNTDYPLERKAIKLPWSDYTDIHKSLEKKFSFAEKQLKKENKVYEEYQQFYLNHNKPTNFSMQFVEKKPESDKLEALISGFLKFCEDNFQTSTSKSSSLSYRIKQQQEQPLYDIKNEYYKIYYKQKYKNNVIKDKQ